MKKLTVAIGIPAFNEEQNIRFLLESLSKQKIKDAILEKIVVVSDGSSDQTVSQARLVKDSRVEIIDRKKRLGLLKTQNEILKLISQDILVLLDADILPANNFLLEEIIKPIIKDKKVGLVGADTISAEPKTFFEGIIAQSHELKKNIYKKINKGHNIYLCHGRARAFSRRFYSLMKWPDSPQEDAFSYLFCIQKGFKFVFAPKAKIIFRSPSTFPDHLKQSKRFFQGKKQMEKYFPREFVRKQYKIPNGLLIQTFFNAFLNNPFAVMIYSTIVTFINLTGSKFYRHKTKWEISSTSKKVIL